MAGKVVRETTGQFGKTGGFFVPVLKDLISDVRSERTLDVCSGHFCRLSGSCCFSDRVLVNTVTFLLCACWGRAELDELIFSLLSF